MSMSRDSASRDEADVRLAQMSNVKLDDSELKKVLSEFASNRELGSLDFDEYGLVHLQVGDDMPVMLSRVEAFPGLVAIARLPEEVAESSNAMRDLLSANLSWDETAGGTFVKFPDSDVVAYCRMISLAEQDARQFERDLTAFAEAARLVIDGIGWSIDLQDEGPTKSDDVPSSVISV
jgi:hypothetical protein